MDYTVLARRFRPQSFAEVAGQEHIAQALRNAITSGRVAHAYLFTGARGVGKTSTARILAKALNCPRAVDGAPCNACEICQGVSTGSDVDVLEIDGASNRGIDEIRSLRANVNIKPMRSPHKVYIIDEVHMLTREAFNALLKTLEEPPPNVKFIFCTTEPQKVPDTILSRCQRFDFGTIATATIKDKLGEIARIEGVTVAPEAVELVARRAAGSMRDSQSLFDQLLAFGGKSIGAADVHRLLGTAPDSRLIELGDALVARNRRAALDLLQAAIAEGGQLSELTDQVLMYFRDLMVLAAGAEDAGLMSVSEEARGPMLAQAKRFGLPAVLSALQILAETKARMRGVTYGRVLAELALVRIASLEDFEHLGGIIDLLKKGGTGSSRSTGASPASGAPAAQPAREPPARTAPGAQKKSSDAAAESYVDSGVATDSATTVSATAPVAFEAGRESEVWLQVITKLPDVTKGHLRNGLRVAISGPSQLVLTFPTSYHKEYFERSPHLIKQVENALYEVVGRPIRMIFTVEQAESAKSTIEAESPPTRGEVDRRQILAQQDPLVQKALVAFEATLVRVDAVAETTPS